MTKRNPGLPRAPRSFYPTPAKALVPTFVRLARQDGTLFSEPCVGDGDLARHLVAREFTCAQLSDIKYGIDAFSLRRIDLSGADMVITNPPWEVELAHPMIWHFVQMELPVWFLMDADWMHTVQAAPYMAYCTDVVSVGRLRWIPGSKHTGFDNAAWYRFHHRGNTRTARFWTRNET